MADSTTNLDLIAVAQAAKETTANALFDAASQSMLFGRRASTSAALTWGVYGGDVLISGVPTAVANTTVALTASRTQQIEAGPVSTSTTAITGVSIANPCVLTFASHPFAVGDVLWLSGIGGTTQLNNSFARVTATTATTCTLAVDSTGFTAYTSGGTAARMTDSGTWTLQVGKGLGSGFVAQTPLYTVVAGVATVTSYTDSRILAGPPGLSGVYGFAAQSVAGAVDVIATHAAFSAARATLLDLTGALTGNVALIMPRLSGRYLVRNSATGAFTLTVRGPGGTGVVIAAGATRQLVCDGLDYAAVT